MNPVLKKLRDMLLPYYILPLEKNSDHFHKDYLIYLHKNPENF